MCLDCYTLGPRSHRNWSLWKFSWMPLGQVLTCIPCEILQYYILLTTVASEITIPLTLSGSWPCRTYWLEGTRQEPKSTLAFLVLPRRLIKSLTADSSASSVYTVSAAKWSSEFGHSCMIAHRQWLWMAAHQTRRKSTLDFHKARSWDPCHYYYHWSMTNHQLLIPELKCISSQMTVGFTNSSR